MPDVGGGRGTAKAMAPTTLQPIVYHEFPVAFWEGVLHSVSGSSIVDLTPQAGRLAMWCVKNHVGYAGVCQTSTQRDYILKARRGIRGAFSTVLLRRWHFAGKLANRRRVPLSDPGPDLPGHLGRPTASPTWSCFFLWHLLDYRSLSQNMRPLNGGFGIQPQSKIFLTHTHIMSKHNPTRSWRTAWCRVSATRRANSTRQSLRPSPTNRRRRSRKNKIQTMRSRARRRSRNRRNPRKVRRPPPD